MRGRRGWWRVFLAAVVAALGLAMGGPARGGHAGALGQAVECASPARPARPLVYAVLGASDAVGVGANDPAREAWAVVLQQRLPPDTRLVNLGRPGNLVRHGLVEQLPRAVEAAPDLAIVWLAVNDFNLRVPLEEYGASLDALLGQLASRTQAGILVANLPDLAWVPFFRNTPRARLQADVGRWNDAIAAVAARHGAVLVDLYALGTELAQRPELVARDGFHPSTEGHRRLAEVMWTAIEESRLLAALPGGAAAGSPPAAGCEPEPPAPPGGESGDGPTEVARPGSARPSAM